MCDDFEIFVTRNGHSVFAALIQGSYFVVHHTYDHGVVSKKPSLREQFAKQHTSQKTPGLVPAYLCPESNMA